MALPSTLDEQVKGIKKEYVAYRRLHQTAILSDLSSKRNIEIPWDTVFRKYRHILEKIKSTLILRDIDMQRIEYKPRVVSEELYGTTELWAEILWLNQCGTVLDFHNIRNLVVYNPEALKSVLNEIMILEKIA